MNEYGETPSIYVWPKDHEEGEPFPEDFYQNLRVALAHGGFEYELV